MLQERIEAADVTLARLIITRLLQDEAELLDCDEVRAALHDDGVVPPQLRFSYPLRKLRISISSICGDVGKLDFSGILKIAQEQASAFRRVVEHCDHLASALSQTRSIAEREIARLRRKGLDVTLKDVQPSVIKARGDRLPSPEATIEVLGSNLLPQRLCIAVAHPEEIVAELGDKQLVERQTVRASRRDWLAEAGAAGAIDGVIAAALRDVGADVADAIQRMLADQEGFRVDAGNRSIDLHWRDGLIGGNFVLDQNATYRRGEVSLDLTLDRATYRHMKGLPAGNILENALLDGHVIASAAGSHGRSRIVLEPRYHLFDRQTFLPQERLFPV